MTAKRRDKHFPVGRLTWKLILPFVAGAWAAGSGCEPPPLTENGVIGSFGAIGLGPGDFSYPRAIDVDDQGNVIVVDKSARVQKFTRTGRYVMGWTMPEQRAGKPVGVTLTPDGRIFVADTHYHRVIVYDLAGRELARFGRPGIGDGEFQLPTDVAVDAAGNIYVSEYNGNDRITKWSPAYEYLGVLVSGDVAGAPLRRPAGIDIDEAQTLWVADACNHRVVRFDLDGRVSTSWGRMGREIGSMRYPYDLACTPDGGVIVCEYGNHRIQWFDADGQSRGVWGKQGRRLGQLWAPWGAALGGDGRLYVLDSLNARVQIVRL